MKQEVAAGEQHTAICLNGELVVWGSGYEGQLGLGKDVVESLSPVAVSLPKLSANSPLKSSVVVTGVSAGTSHTLIYTEDGLLYTFGEVADG